jgi:hypothetical protein
MEDAARLDNVVIVLVTVEMLITPEGVPLDAIE